MGMVFEFHLCRPGFRRASLFGRPDGARIWLLKLGFAQIVGVPTELFGVAQEVIDLHLAPGEYLVGKEAELCAKREDLRGKALSEAEQSWQERMGWWQKEVEKADGRRRRAQAELEAYRASVLTLSRMVASVFPEGAVVEGGALTRAAADLLAERQHEIAHAAYETQEEAAKATQDMASCALSFLAFALSEQGGWFDDDTRAALERAARDVWPSWPDRFSPEELPDGEEDFPRARLIRALAYGLAAVELSDTREHAPAKAPR